MHFISGYLTTFWVLALIVVSSWELHQHLVYILNNSTLFMVGIPRMLQNDQQINNRE